jgi:anti-sigma B factor antagonist
MLQIDVYIDGDAAVVAVKGEFTLEDTSLLSDKVRALLGEGHRKFILDLASVSYVDSAGLGEIIHIYVTVRREGAVLQLRLNTQIADLLRATKLLTMFNWTSLLHTSEQRIVSRSAHAEYPL